jgi:hypothetical protein
MRLDFLAPELEVVIIIVIFALIIISALVLDGEN